MSKKEKKLVTKNSKELAEAIGLEPADAVEWEMRHSLTHKIQETVKKSGMTITAIANASGTSRARVTKILKGHSQGISIDVLLRVLGAVGQSIRISYKKASYPATYSSFELSL